MSSNSLSCVCSPQVAQDNLAMAWARSVCMNDSKAAAAVGAAQRAERTTAAMPPGESRGWWRCWWWRHLPEKPLHTRACTYVASRIVATYLIRPNVNNGFVWLHHLPSKVPRAIPYMHAPWWWRTIIVFRSSWPSCSAVQWRSLFIIRAFSTLCLCILGGEESACLMGLR